MSLTNGIFMKIFLSKSKLLVFLQIRLKVDKMYFKLQALIDYCPIFTHFSVFSEES